MEVRLDGDVNLGQTYNSNIVLTDPPKGVFGTRLDADARLAVKERNWEASGGARLDQQFFYPDSGIDMTNVYADGSGSYLTERSRWNLAGSYVDAWSLASEGQPLNVSGVILTRLHRNTQSLGPSWTYALDETTSATLGYGYSHADYEFGGGGSSLQESHTATSELLRQIDEHLSASFDLSYSHYSTTRENPDYSTTSDYISGMLGLKYAFGETLSLNASAGAQYTRTESQYIGYRLLGYIPVSLDPLRYAPVVESYSRSLRQDTPVAPIFSLTARQRFETSELNLNYARQINPSFNGLMLTIDRVSLAGSRRLAESLDGGLTLAYYRQSSSDPRTVADYSAYSLDGTLTWHWDSHWSARATYQYMIREADAAIPNADSHMVLLNLRYDFDGFSF
jgi:hypothetical protein